MEDFTETIKETSGRLVHEFSAHSYFVYMAAIVIGFGLDELFSSFSTLPRGLESWGAVLIVLGTILVVWARSSARKSQGNRHGGPSGTEEVHGHHFHAGPYSLMRTPTPVGLFLMTIGLAFIFHSLWITILTIMAFLVSRFVFVPRKEKHLAKKYGQAFLDYKKKVRF